MFYFIASHLSSYYSALHLFEYVSVRAACALLTALLLACFFGKWFINFSSRHFRSKVREWTPENHAKKNDTPTMGGLFILLIFFAATVLWSDLTHSDVWLFAACLSTFGAIGFFDDWSKIIYKKGISARAKFYAQWSAAALIATGWYFLAAPSTELCFPFFKNFHPALGLLLIPWAMFIMVGTSNAVNLTDGLDGLASGPLIFAFSTYGFIAYLAGHAAFSSYLNIPFAGTAELVVSASALIGGLIGFLWYNAYPAQMFMGDVGALSLGAGLAFLALTTRQELLLPLVGGIFVIETLSVMLQVFSFRYLGRRIFKMAPIHHHFELVGWHESKITIRFWIISFVLCLIALLTLKVR